MAKSLSRTLFAGAQRMERLRRRMLREATAALRATQKTATPARTRTTKAKTPAKSAARPGPRDADGAGTWRNAVLAATAPGLAEMRYAVYLPAGRPAAGLPVVVMLHGCGQGARDFARGTRMNLLADDQGFAVVYPQQAARHHAHRCWRWFAPGENAGGAEADAIAAATIAAATREGLDIRRVYLAGLSAGAGMAALVALRHPGLARALALHSGVVMGAARTETGGLRAMRHGARQAPAGLVASLLPPAPGRARMPALIVHGLDDRVVAPDNATQLAEQFRYWNGLEAAAAVATPVHAGTRRAYHRIEYRDGARTVVRVCLIEGLGHAWSGGDPAYRFHAAEGPRATELIWRFFRAQ